MAILSAFMSFWLYIGGYSLLTIFVFNVVYKEISWRKWVVPILPGVIAIDMIVSYTKTSFIPLLMVGIAIFLLASSDVLFEVSEDISIPALGLGLAHTLIIGVQFNILAFSQEINLFVYLLILIVAGMLGFVAKSRISEPDDFKIPILVYLVFIIIQLAGGIACLYLGLTQPGVREYDLMIHFGLWGILLFFSDVIVAYRAFPSKDIQIPIIGTNEKRILLSILLIYYPAMVQMFMLTSKILTSS